MTRRSITLLLMPALAATILVYIAPILVQLAATIDLSDLYPARFAASILNSNVTRVFVTTFRVSLIVTVVSCVLSYTISYFIVFWSGRFHFALLFIVIVSLWISVLVRVVGLIYILQPNGFVNSFLLWTGLVSQPVAFIRNELGVIIGMVHYMLPVAILPIYSDMSGLDRNVIRSACSLGARDRQILWRIIIPLTKAGLVTSLFVSFVFCLGFYVTPCILGGGRSVMIAEYISLLIQQTMEWSIASILSLFLVLMLCVLGGLAHLVLRRLR